MNLKTFSMLSLAAALVLAAGCKSPSVYDPESGKLTSGRNAPGATKMTPPTGLGLNPNGDWKPDTAPLPTDDELVNGKRWEGGAVYFAFDNDSVLDSERPKVETVIKFLNENAAVSVLVEGHCDDRGSDEYNRGLGERRANAIRNYITAAGIAADRVLTVSYGEERPAVPNASTEEQFYLNRRGEFVFGTVREKLVPSATAPAAAPATTAPASTPVEVAPAPAPVEVGS